MFEHWPDEVAPTLRREVSPPTPVVVDLALAIPSGTGSFRRDGIPLRIRSGGLNVSGRVPGLLHAWARTNTGNWLALVEFVLATANNRGRVPVRQWCSEAAVSPNPPARRR
ncbi:hypothetical protein [Nocardia stercoris]|uniref:Uncharacterized protein n=1 Tax=Nocardia stercoris TaxID=2483361 RepID=A0A3M2KSN9_9NOCA|nr:hypothetical protein [Nocardia stercoris]RMI27934.1 hypothetical protein EBN03_32385 [Nocardia stercoris]